MIDQVPGLLLCFFASSVRIVQSILLTATDTKCLLLFVRTTGRASRTALSSPVSKLNSSKQSSHILLLSLLHGAVSSCPPLLPLLFFFFGLFRPVVAPGTLLLVKTMGGLEMTGEPMQIMLLTLEATLSWSILT